MSIARHIVHILDEMGSFKDLLPSKKLLDLFENDTIHKKVLSQKPFGKFMIQKSEVWTMDGCPPTPVDVVYTNDGKYVGNPEFAKHLEKLDIDPKLVGNNTVCSIGFSPKTNLYYGWSHRAIVGFGINDKIFDAKLLGDFGSTNKWSNTPFNKVGTVDIKTLDQAKEAAINFSKYIS